MGANVEDLFLLGTARKGTGNELDNVIYGSSAANVLSGAGGNDVLRGFDGIDRMIGGTGADTFVIDINSTTVPTDYGNVSIDMILDFSSTQGDKIDLSQIDFNGAAAGNGTINFVGSGPGSVAGDVSFVSYANVDAAEAALGYDIDGINGPGSAAPVTILFGHTNNDGMADFAIVLFDTSTITRADLSPPPAMLA